MKRFGQFFGVALVGLAIDIAIAWALFAAGLELKLAATCGFLSATFVNYVLNQRWTFADSGHRKSVGGFARFVASALVALLVRLAALWLMQIALPVALQIAPLMLLAAAGVSLLVNFHLVQRYVFPAAR